MISRPGGQLKLSVSLIVMAASLIFLAGCSGSLRSTWVNFNSYYNTFYNAKQSYDRGYRQVEGQVDRINQERPIRAHRAPVRVGRDHFEDTIERGADLLIRFPTSRYVDDALELIGKSYYYLENFFNAEQKFIELYTTTESNDKRQSAVIWRARVMLDLERHNEGISYLTAQFDSPEIEWSRRQEAEAQILMAQFLVKTQQWEEASEWLYEALPNTRDREIRARGYFLHGQILEYLGEYDAAYGAYDNVRRSNPVYQLVYLSRLKMGIMLRNMGDYEEARRHFVSMTRDNKNYENISEMNFQIARTMQAMGRAEDAKRYYREVLYFSQRTPVRELLAKAHYGFAELYRFDFRNYNLAAAHYDTSARNASEPDLLPYGFDARELSRSFNEFARLSNQEAEKDSLLWLGSLEPAEFDSVIARIQQQYAEEMRREQRERDRDTGVIVSVDPDEIEEAAEVGSNGFLNHLNPQRLAQVSQAFQSLWDGRPLVDNWRRSEAVRRATILAEEAEDEETEDLDIIYVEEVTIDEFELDLSNIPRTRDARNTMLNEMARIRYEIGNVYFVSLAMPDSARSYFHRVINEHPNSEFVPQAMYSLSESYYLQNDLDTAREWAERVVADHPNTIFGRRLADRFGIDGEFEDIVESPEERMLQDYHQLLASLDASDLTYNAYRLTNFAKQDTLTGHAADALFSAATFYIQEARQDSAFAERVSIWQQENRRVERERDDFTALRDSALVAVEADTLSEEKLEYWQGIIDSTFVEPDLRELFPYTGEKWDLARENLELLAEKHSSYSRITRVRTLLDEIRPPADPSEDEEVVEEGEEYVIESNTYLCEDLEFTPEIESDLNQFYRDSGIVDQMMNMNILEATFSYRLTIDHFGTVLNAQSLQDEDEFGLATLLREAMMEDLKFVDPMFEGEHITVICEVDFPISVYDIEEEARDEE